MRVLHIATFLQGGAGRVIASLAAAQQRGGWDVRVAADAGGEPGYATYPEYVDQLRKAGAGFLTVDSTFKRDRRLNLRAAATLRRASRSWQPDIVHAHAAIPGLVGRLAFRRAACRVPIVHTMHGWGVAKTPEQARCDVRILSHADAVITPSAAARQTIAAAGVDAAAVQVIPYGIDESVPVLPPDEADAAMLQSFAAGRRTAMCVGTIGERKNQRLLVEALRHPALSNLVAVFVGDGDARSLTDYAGAHGVADRVAVLGHRTDASRYLSIADVLVLPSRNEGLPLAVLEAMRAGVPVAASDIPEIAEALGGHGQLFAVDEPDGLAHAISRALNTQLLESGRAGSSAFVRERYSLPRMTAAYGALYGRVIAQP